MNQMGIAVVFALSFNMLLGQGGLLWFGHAVYFGLGGFIAAHVLNLAGRGTLWIPVPVLPLVGGLGGLAFAILFGSFSPRRAGTVFAMISLGVAELMAASSLIFDRFFGGEEGITTNRSKAPLLLGLPFTRDREVYYLIAFWLFVAALAMYAFSRTPVGRMANAVRDNPERAAHRPARGALSADRRPRPRRRRRHHRAPRDDPLRRGLRGGGRDQAPVLDGHRAAHAHAVAGLLGAGGGGLAGRALDGAARGVGLRPGESATGGGARRRHRRGEPVSTTAAIELVEVRKSFGSTPIIRGVSLALEAGTRQALIGPNGAGKSTLFNLITGKYRVTTGRIRVKGEDVTDLRPYEINRLGLARSFQVTDIFTRMTVFENLRCAALWGAGYRYSFWHRVSTARAVNERAETVLEQLNLTARRDVPAGVLSYAEQRALEIGITIAGGADVVLLDEPTAGMSRSETEHVIQLIRHVTAGKTLVMVEHDMSVVFDLADRIAVLVYGEVIAHDTPERIRANASVQEAYLGVPQGVA